MIRFIKGNLFDSQAQTLVNTVNCVGVMGKGVALEFKKMFPDMYEEYRQQCARGEIQPGKLTIYSKSTPWVLNFPTKRHWKGRSRIEYVESGLRELTRIYRDLGIISLGMPALGCGHGGLDWSVVRPMIERYLGDLDIQIDVYEPGSEKNPKESDTESLDTTQVFQSNMFGDDVKIPKKKKSKKAGKPTI